MLGAGAVGCYFGGMLARAGHPVTFIGRAVHVDAIRRDGLRFETLKFDEHVRAEASTGVAAVKGAKLVLFCVKSTDTASAAREMAPHLDPDGIVVSLQNGVDNAERIQQVIGRAIVAAVVYVATEMAGPGHLKHHGRGDLVIGALPGLPAEAAALARVRDTFVAAGVPVAVSDDVEGELWGKLVVNCAYNAVSAIGQQPYGTMVRVPGIRALMKDVVDEALAIAAARGVRLAPDTQARVAAIAEAMPTQYSSTAQDLARGRATEIDHLNGYLVREGEARGIPVPANRALHALVKLIESKTTS
jgi:2-dehydropantoate 2-reductase